MRQPPRRRWDEIIHDTESVKQVEKDQIELDALHARILDTPDGQKLLDYWHAVTLGGVLPMDSSDGALREMEANRRFVRGIEQRILRHRDRVAKPKAK